MTDDKEKIIELDTDVAGTIMSGTEYLQNFKYTKLEFDNVKTHYYFEKTVQSLRFIIEK